MSQFVISLWVSRMVPLNMRTEDRSWRGGPLSRANEWKRVRGGDRSPRKQAGAEEGSGEGKRRQENLTSVELVGPLGVA